MFWLLFGTFLIATMAAATTGAMFEPGKWYRDLNKPSWNPPDWVFPVAWTILYLCMATAAARVAMIDGTGLALAFWSAQIAFNTLWTPVFFGLTRIKAGMAIVLCLWATVAATMVAFFQFDTIAGWLFVPYLVWVSIASALNAAVWRLNPEAAAKG